MVEKALGNTEALKGFIQIPIKSRNELVRGLFPPFKTLVNGETARMDRYWRLWVPSLKGKFSLGSRVQVSRTQEGYQVELIVGEEQNKDSRVKVDNKGGEQVTPKSEMGIKPKPFFEVNNLTIYQDDVIKSEAIKYGSIDLIVTSPPYNVDIRYETYDDDIPHEKYLEFSEKWLTKCYSLAKDDGRLCLNIPLDKNKGGQQSICADITTIAKKVGWKYHATIIWNEQNISRRTAWGSWLSASAPYVIAPVEVIVVLYKKRWEKIRKGKSDIIRDEFIEWTNAVWNFQGESRTRVGHPTPFPVELPKRCIKLFSFVGDTVLDPFLGSGTTLIACLETNRVGVGVEINQKYCELAVKRLKEHGIFQKRLEEAL